MLSHLFGVFFLSIINCIYCKNIMNYGPYEVDVHKFRQCPDGPRSPKIYVDVKERRFNRTTYSYDANVTNSVPIDNNIIARAEAMERTSRGVYKFAMAQNYKNPCTLMETLIPDVVNILRKNIRTQTGETFCPLPPGSRLFKDMTYTMVFPEFQKMVPKYYYSSFILKLKQLNKKEEVMGCFMLNIDILPKTKNSNSAG